MQSMTPDDHIAIYRRCCGPAHGAVFCFCPVAADRNAVPPVPIGHERISSKPVRRNHYRKGRHVNEDMLVRVFVASAVGVLFGSLGRRARELDAMDVITGKVIARMLIIEAMLLPSGAGFSALLVFYLEVHWLFTLAIGIAAGLGGFATGTLIFDLFRKLLTGFAEQFNQKGGS